MSSSSCVMPAEDASPLYNEILANVKCEIEAGIFTLRDSSSEQILFLEKQQSQFLGIAWAIFYDADPKYRNSDAYQQLAAVTDLVTWIGWYCEQIQREITKEACVREAKRQRNRARRHEAQQRRAARVVS
jgi:hypothetical protein